MHGSFHYYPTNYLIRMIGFHTAVLSITLQRRKRIHFSFVYFWYTIYKTTLSIYLPDYTIPNHTIFTVTTRHTTHRSTILDLWHYQSQSSLFRFSLTALIWYIPPNNNGMAFANWKIADNFRPITSNSSSSAATAILDPSNQLIMWGSAFKVCSPYLRPIEIAVPYHW